MQFIQANQDKEDGGTNTNLTVTTGDEEKEIKQTTEQLQGFGNEASKVAEEVQASETITDDKVKDEQQTRKQAQGSVSATSKIATGDEEKEKDQTTDQLQGTGNEAFKVAEETQASELEKKASVDGLPQEEQNSSVVINVSEAASDKQKEGSLKQENKASEDGLSPNEQSSSGVIDVPKEGSAAGVGKNYEEQFKIKKASLSLNLLVALLSTCDENSSGAVKEILGTDGSLGCIVDSKDPKDVRVEIDKGDVKVPDHD